MFSYLKSLLQKSGDRTPLPQVDIHSHLLPGIDDGVKTVEEAINLLRSYQEAGFKKAITTPHVIFEYYPNDATSIGDALKRVQHEMTQTGLEIALEAAAEYYLDESLLQLLDSGDELLTLGDHYLLIETGFRDKPLLLEEAIFRIRTKGYAPILAHPERYYYLSKDWDLTESLKDSGVLFQLNINSLSGMYNADARKMAEKLIDQKMVDFIGSDCHGQRHFNTMMKTVAQSRYWNKLMSLPLKNDELI